MYADRLRQQKPATFWLTGTPVPSPLSWTPLNAKAEELGCADTHFVNPNGLHDPDHYTSAWDLYLITKAAMQYPGSWRSATAPRP